jgi:hypothetical protein
MDHSSTIRELISILSSTPQLCRLKCELLNELNQSIGEDVKLTLPYLTHIFIDDCPLQFNDFEIFIRKVGSQLQVLRVNTSNDTAYLDADRWERLLSKQMPHLRRFEFQHCEFVLFEFEFTQHHALLRRFTSPFWTKRRWIIELTIEIFHWIGIGITYSIHPNR